MKKNYLLIIACLMLIQEVNAQNGFLSDSLFVTQWVSEPGVKPGFDLAEFEGNRFDATGDGVSELVTVEDNVNGNPVVMRVKDLKQDLEVMTIDLARIRQSLLANGYSVSQISALSFRGFYKWTTGVNAVLFTADQAPVVYDPFNDNLFCYLEAEFLNTFGVSDLDGDGYPELIVGQKTQRQVYVLSSVFAPGG